MASSTAIHEMEVMDWRSASACIGGVEEVWAAARAKAFVPSAHVAKWESALNPLATQIMARRHTAAGDHLATGSGEQGCAMEYKQHDMQWKLACPPESWQTPV